MIFMIAGIVRFYSIKSSRTPHQVRGKLTDAGSNHQTSFDCSFCLDTKRTKKIKVSINFPKNHSEKRATT